MLGELSFWIGNYAAAKSFYEECLKIAEETGERFRVAMGYSDLSMMAYRQNQPADIENMADRPSRSTRK